MSYLIRIFCQSRQDITRSEIMQFIEEGVYFERVPEFEPSLDSVEAQEHSWQSLIVKYHVDKRPIIFSRNIYDKLLRDELSEILSEVPSEFPEDLKRALSSSYQVIAIDSDPMGLTDEAWGMLDCVESHIAKKLEGIVYAPADGFFDPDLQKIFAL